MRSNLRISYDRFGEIESIVMPRPSNFHVHFRWDALMRAVSTHIMKHMRYLLAMPNNGPNRGLIRTLEDAIMYHDKLMELAIREGIKTLNKILMSVYHTAEVTTTMIEKIARAAVKTVIKNYPAHPGATTGSGHSIPFDACDDEVRAMEDNEVSLHLHAEDVYDKNGIEMEHEFREGHCIRERAWRFRDKHKNLRLCIEHASTKEAVEFVKADTSGRTVMTVTPQHLLFTIDDFERYSWKNHLRCMPIVKREDDRQAVLEFATSGDPRCIAGDDTAPHLSKTKGVADPSKSDYVPFLKVSCGCWLPHSPALYMVAFKRAKALDNNRFVQFMSLNGAAWHGLSPPDDDDTLTIRVEKEHDIPDPVVVPEHDDVVIPLGYTTEPDRLKIGYAAAMAE